MMITLLEKDWVFSWVSGFTPIMQIKSIFDSKILTCFFLQENNKHKLHILFNICQVFFIVMMTSSFALFFFFACITCFFLWIFAGAFLKTLVRTSYTSALLHLYDFITELYIRKQMKFLYQA